MCELRSSTMADIPFCHKCLIRELSRKKGVTVHMGNFTMTQMLKSAEN